MTCDEIVLLETPGPSSDIFQAETECSSSRMKSLVGDLIAAAQQVGATGVHPQYTTAYFSRECKSPTFRWSHHTRLDVFVETALPCSLLLDEWTPALRVSAVRWVTRPSAMLK